MSTEYDSKKIRTLAKQIERAASSVSEVKSNTLQGILREMPANFRGSAATALNDRVTDLVSDVNTISSQLSAISAALNRLAAQVEYADRQAKTIIGSR